MSKFAKHHYEVIALAMQDAKAYASNNSAQQLIVDHLIGRFANEFAHDNSMFKRDRFIRACQPGANVRASAA